MKQARIILLIALLSLSLMMLSGCSFTTARFENLATSSDVDDDYYPINETSTFSTTSPIVYLTGSIKNATIDAIIQVDWYYIDGDDQVFIADTLLTVDDVNMDFYFSLSKPTNDWPTGDYEIRLYYDAEHMETVAFKVE